MKIINRIPYLSPVHEAAKTAKIAGAEIRKNSVLQYQIALAGLSFWLCHVANEDAGDAGVLAVLLASAGVWSGLFWLGWRTDRRGALAISSAAFGLAALLTSTVYIGAAL